MGVWGLTPGSEGSNNLLCGVCGVYVVYGVWCVWCAVCGVWLDSPSQIALHIQKSNMVGVVKVVGLSFWPASMCPWWQSWLFPSIPLLGGVVLRLSDGENWGGTRGPPGPWRP
jgi:hypothetical protein